MAVAAQSLEIPMNRCLGKPEQLGKEMEVSVLPTEDDTSYSVNVKKLSDLTEQDLKLNEIFVKVVLKNHTCWRLYVEVKNESINRRRILDPQEERAVLVNRRFLTTLYTRAEDVPAPNGSAKKCSPTRFVAFCLGIEACLWAIFATIAAIFRRIRP